MLAAEDLLAEARLRGTRIGLEAAPSALSILCMALGRALSDENYDSMDSLMRGVSIMTDQVYGNARFFNAQKGPRK